MKKLADEVIADGHYASFSDFARTAFRQILRDYKLDRMVAEAKEDYKAGRGTLMRNKKDIKKFMTQFAPKNA